MRIENWDIQEQPNTVEVSAEVDGFRLWYRCPSAYQFARTGDPFVAAALLPAMLKGEKLVIDPSLSVSPKLLDNISRLQEIHNCWNPQFKIISIDAAIKSPAEPINYGTLAFFSGGVDSMYTFLKNTSEISHLAFIHGFDFYLRDNGIYLTAVKRNASFVGNFGKTLIPIETNHYQFGYRYNLSRNLTQGSALAGVALLLGFPRAYVPGAYSYSQLIPLGSHPLTDPLWSNECVNIIHDGAEARRVDKVKKIAQSNAALANLRVCFNDMNVNCGKCAKCLRTMLPLNLLDASAAPFPSLPPIREIRKLHIANDIEAIFFKENVELALEATDKKLMDALCACLRRHEYKKLFKAADRVLLGGVVKRAYCSMVRTPNVERRIDSTPWVD